MDNVEVEFPKRMHKRLVFENNHHHRRLVGFTPPFSATGFETAAAPTTRAVATTPATQQATRPANTPAAAPTTEDAKNDKKKDTINEDVTTILAATPTTARVAVTTPSTTVARTTPAVSTATPAVATSLNGVNSVAALNPTTSQVQQFTITRTTKAAGSSQTSSTGLPSPSAAADDGPSVGAIAGYAAGALAGIAVISMFAIWIIRRKRRREEDADIDAAPFNRQSWLRHSTMIHDDAPANLPPPRRDPEMIDRSLNSTPVTNYAGMNQYPQNNFGYATQPSYQPGAIIFSPSSANTSFGPGGGPATPLPYSPGYDPATPNPFEQQGGYTEVTRDGPPSPYNPFHHQQQFDEIQRQMTPSAPPAPVEDYSLSPRAPSPRIESGPPVLPPVNPAASGAAYPELSPAPTSAHGHVVEVRASTYEGQATPVQYGFAEAHQPPVVPSVTTGPQPAAGRALTRPETVYDTEDAYGGI